MKVCDICSEKSAYQIVINDDDERIDLCIVHLTEVREAISKAKKEFDIPKKGRKSKLKLLTGS